MQKFYDLGYELAGDRQPLSAFGRGNIIDIYPALANAASRIDFDGDTIESIKELGKKAGSGIKQIIIPPASWRSLPRQVKFGSTLTKFKTISFEHFPAQADVTVAVRAEMIKLIEARLS